MRNLSHKQDGTVLVVGLVMLVVLTLFVVSAIRGSNINQRIAGNMQVKEEVNAAVDVAIENAIKDIKDTTSVAALGNKKDLITVAGVQYEVNVLKPQCVFAVQLAKLDPTMTEKERSNCIDEYNDNPLSSCSDSQLLIEATVTDTDSGATVTHGQGIRARMDTELAMQVCGTGL